MDRAALTVRELQSEDAVFMNRYWEEATDEDLARMGEPARPDAEENAAFIRQFCAERLPPAQAEEGILIWCCDGRPMGYSSVKEIQFQKEAQIHLHLWEKELRGRGFGAVLFCLSALRFIELFELKSLYCQPKADNPHPNAMLRKIGFPNLGSVTCQRGDKLAEQNRYLIRRDIAEAYLAARA